jgi:hypothetical protein
VIEIKNMTKQLSGILLFTIGIAVGLGAGVFLGQGQFSSSNSDVAKEMSSVANTLAQDSGLSGVQTLADFDVEMKNAAKGLSVAYLDQRDRLNMQDRVAAVAEMEGFETSILSILEQDYTPVEESHLLNPIFEKWAKLNLTETADFAVTLPKTTR